MESFKEREPAPAQVSLVPFSPHTKVTHTHKCLTSHSTFPPIFLLSVNKNVKLTESLLFLFPELSFLTLPVRLPLCHLFMLGRSTSSLSWLPQLAAPLPLSPISSILFAISGSLLQQVSPVSLLQATASPSWCLHSSQHLLVSLSFLHLFSCFPHSCQCVPSAILGGGFLISLLSHPPLSHPPLSSATAGPIALTPFPIFFNNFLGSQRGPHHTLQLYLSCFRFPSDFHHSSFAFFILPKDFKSALEVHLGFVTPPAQLSQFNPA